VCSLHGQSPKAVASQVDGARPAGRLRFKSRRWTKFFVAQIRNLLYRRIPIGMALNRQRAWFLRNHCGLQIRETAGCNPALRGGTFFPALLKSSLPARISNSA
jgi:hypothetical protein